MTARCLRRGMFPLVLGLTTMLVSLAASPAGAWFRAGGFHAGGFHAGAVHVGGYHAHYVGGWHAHGVGWGHPGCYGCGVYHPYWHPVAAAAAVGTAAAVGAAVGAAATAPVVSYPTQATALPIGSTAPSLPSGCALVTRSGVKYYNCDNTWYRPSFGSNGVFYKVVAAP